MNATATRRISPQQVADGELPDDATGVLWTDTNWTECADHLTDPSWRDGMAGELGSDTQTGIVLTGTIHCDACAEAEAGR